MKLSLLNASASRAKDCASSTSPMRKAGEGEPGGGTGDDAGRLAGTSQLEHLGVHLGEQSDVSLAPGDFPEATDGEDQTEMVVVLTKHDNRVAELLAAASNSPETTCAAPSAKLA